MQSPGKPPQYQASSQNRADCHCKHLLISVHVISKGLHYILQQVDHRSLVAWFNDNPCRLHTLAPIVLDALEYEGCALDIIEAFSPSPVLISNRDIFTDSKHAACSQRFRDHALESKPMLLETLLQKSQESDRGFERVSRERLVSSTISN